MLRLLEQLPEPVPTPEPEEVDSMFPDVKKHWAKADVEKAVQDGIMTGYPDGTFGPDDPVTRAQAAAIANRVILKVQQMIADR